MSNRQRLRWTRRGWYVLFRWNDGHASFSRGRRISFDHWREVWFGPYPDADSAMTRL